MTIRRLFLLLVCSTLLTGCIDATQPQVQASISAVEAVNANDTKGFARATEPRPFVFPQDHGPHPEYQIEWWYYTGNLQSQEGHHFGYQFTIFRRGLTADPAQRTSAWGTQNIYMAHLALSDVANERFYAYDRFSRDGAGLAGATGDPFRVFLEDWIASGSGPEGMQMHLHAAEYDIALDLTLENTKPPVLQGNQGLSQKGAEVGNASHYYSLTRMATTGYIRVEGETYAVQGLSWMDREFSTSGLEAGLVGWDWFSLQLDDQRELMFYQLRQEDGSMSPFTAGVIVAPDGTTTSLAAGDVQLDVLDTWRSPRSGTAYPAQWRMTLPDEDLTLEITPYLADQELPVSVVYWEGAVRVTGTQQGQPLRGNGYVELTGYADTGTGGTRSAVEPSQ